MLLLQRLHNLKKKFGQKTKQRVPIFAKCQVCNGASEGDEIAGLESCTVYSRERGSKNLCYGDDGEGGISVDSGEDKNRIL